MAYTNPYTNYDLPPKGLTFLLLAIGLVTIVTSIIAQNLIIAAVVICLPIAAIILIYGSQSPRLGYLLSVSYTHLTLPTT